VDSVCRTESSTGATPGGVDKSAVGTDELGADGLPQLVTTSIITTRTIRFIDTFPPLR
jgi:hypothetical protein